MNTLWGNYHWRGLFSRQFNVFFHSTKFTGDGYINYVIYRTAGLIQVTTNGDSMLIISCRWRTDYNFLLRRVTRILCHICMWIVAGDAQRKLCELWLIEVSNFFLMHILSYCGRRFCSSTSGLTICGRGNYERGISSLCNAVYRSCHQFVNSVMNNKVFSTFESFWVLGAGNKIQGLGNY